MEFVDNYRKLVTASNTELLIWNIGLKNNTTSKNTPAPTPKKGTPTKEDNATPAKNGNTPSKSPPKPKEYEVTCKLSNQGDLDEPSLQHPAVKVYSSNLPNDNLLFVTSGSNIKVMSAISTAEIITMVIFYL